MILVLMIIVLLGLITITIAQETKSSKAHKDTRREPMDEKEMYL